MPYFDHDNVRFHYSDTGTGKPFVFLHGLGGNMSSPLGVFSQKEGFRVISMDFRGHGDSHYSGPPEVYQIARFADDVLALMDFLQLQKVIIGGISLGSAVSLNLATRFPDRFLRFVLVRPAWIHQSFPSNLDLIVEIGQLIKTHGVDRGKEIFLNNKDFQTIQENNYGCAFSILGQFERPQATTSYEALIELPRSIPFETWEMIQKIPQPALVIVNEDDPLHPWEMGVEIASHLPNAQLLGVAPRYKRPKKYQLDAQSGIDKFLSALE